MVGWITRTVNVDIHTVAMMNAVDDRSSNSHGGRWLWGIALDSSVVLMLYESWGDYQ